MDLLLDRAAAAQGDGGTLMTTTFASQAGVSNERVASAQKVLNLLDAVPADEPSPDLVARTLARVERFAREAAPVSPAEAMLRQAAASQPVA